MRTLDRTRAIRAAEVAGGVSLGPRLPSSLPEVVGAALTSWEPRLAALRGSGVPLAANGDPPSGVPGMIGAAVVPAGWTYFSPGYYNGSTASPVANTLYYVAAPIPAAATLTGIQVFVGTAAGNAVVALYDSSGNRLAVSNALALVGLNRLLVPFTATYAAAAGMYFLAANFSSAAATLSFAASMVPAGSAAQGGNTAPATITPATISPFVNTPMMSTY